MLRVPRKLPPDVLQGCYGATDAVIYRAAQRHEGRKQATRSEARPISRGASWTRLMGQHRPMRTRLRALVSVWSGRAGRPCAEAARVEEPDQHDRAGDNCGDPAGSRKGRGIAQQTDRQTCQQQSCAQRRQSAHDRPVASLEPNAPGICHPGGQLFLRRSAHPQSPSDKASSVPRSCLRLAAPASAPPSYITRASAWLRSSGSSSPTSLQTASTSARRRSRRSQSTGP